MYAIIDVGGKQIRVEPNVHVRIPRLDLEVGSQVTFDRVYLLRSDGDIRIGEPLVEGASVVGKVVAHGRGEKIVVYKYKRRKYYRRKRGHRQPYTEVVITEISS